MKPSLSEGPDKDIEVIMKARPHLLDFYQRDTVFYGARPSGGSQRYWTYYISYIGRSGLTMATYQKKENL